MIPLIIPGIVSLASSAIDTWNEMSAAKHGAAPQAQEQEQFAAHLQKADAALASRAAASQQNVPPGFMINSISSRLMQSPEIQAALGGRGLRQTSLRIGADGSMTMEVAGRPPQSMVLSPELQSLAQQLHSLLLQPGQAGATVQSAAPTTFQAPGASPNVVLFAA